MNTQMEETTATELVSTSPGSLLLGFMQQLKRLGDAELRALVHARVANQDELNSFDALSKEVSHDTLLLLASRALTHQAMQHWHRAHARASSGR